MVRSQSPGERNFDLNLIPEEGEEMAIQDQYQFHYFHKASGFVFNPTDPEIILGYLKRFSDGEGLPQNKIHEKNLYLYHPDQLSVSFEKANDKEMFFITLRNGGTERGRSVNGVGFWHSTTGRRDVLLGNRVIGQKQHFTFFNGKMVKGKLPKDGKTTWLMVEYTLVDANKSSAELTMDVDSNISIKSSSNVKEPKMNFVLSKIYKSDPVENKMEDYADVIKQHQEMAIRDEELWQQINTVT